MHLIWSHQHSHLNWWFCFRSRLFWFAHWNQPRHASWIFSSPTQHWRNSIYVFTIAFFRRLLLLSSIYFSFLADMCAHRFVFNKRKFIFHCEFLSELTIFVRTSFVNNSMRMRIIAKVVFLLCFSSIRWRTFFDSLHLPPLLSLKHKVRLKQEK